MSNELEMKYFVLKPKGNDAYASASRAALLAYAKRIESENSQLAEEIIDWAIRELPSSLLSGQEDIADTSRRE